MRIEITLLRVDLTKRIELTADNKLHFDNYVETELLNNSFLSVMCSIELNALTAM